MFFMRGIQKNNEKIQHERHVRDFDESYELGGNSEEYLFYKDEI